MSAHDRYLAAYHRYETSAWCANPACPTYREEQTVLFEEEYGQGWVTPEECPECHEHWLGEPPPDDEEADE